MGESHGPKSDMRRDQLHHFSLPARLRAFFAFHSHIW
jgi:hypothetical protein